MTDLEMTRLCAESMGITYRVHSGSIRIWDTPRPSDGMIVSSKYDPLHDDAQAMALVKKMDVSVARHGDIWCAVNLHSIAKNADLCRAIVECVAETQQAKVKNVA